MATIDSRTWSLSERLRRSRLFAGLEQEQMARALGVARNTVSNWERGRSEPPASSFVRWASLVGVPLEWLAEGVDAPLGDLPALSMDVDTAQLVMHD